MQMKIAVSEAVQTTSTWALFRAATYYLALLEGFYSRDRSFRPLFFIFPLEDKTRLVLLPARHFVFNLHIFLVPKAQSGLQNKKQYFLV